MRRRPDAAPSRGEPEPAVVRRIASLGCNHGAEHRLGVPPVTSSGGSRGSDRYRRRRCPRDVCMNGAGPRRSRATTATRKGSPSPRSPGLGRARPPSRHTCMTRLMLTKNLRIAPGANAVLGATHAEYGASRDTSADRRRVGRCCLAGLPQPRAAAARDRRSVFEIRPQQSRVHVRRRWMPPDSDAEAPSSAATRSVVTFAIPGGAKGQPMPIVALSAVRA